MNNHFKISELCIDKTKQVPQLIADKILLHHIVVMNPVREALGEPIYVSQHSGWRPEEWEKARGRSGLSQHCFKGNSLGAVDWTIGGVDKHEVDGDFESLFKLIVMLTPYTRIAVYPDARFIHCDYKADERQLFLSNNASKWKLSDFDTILSKI
jgi:hypothetical protein